LSEIEKAEKGAKVELKVDTGMHRNGIALNELDKALILIEKQGLNLVGLMTHFRSADEMGSEFFWQQKQFETVKNKVQENGFKNVRFHSHNSAAILRSRNFDEDMVRVGIAAYGYNELPYPFDDIPFKAVMVLHASKISTREVTKSQRLGYAGDFTAPNDMTVSTYDLGYGDGWTRADSTKPYITAERLPILGRVSMDFILLESQEDDVIIMNNAKEAAKQFGTISYEMTTSLSCEIPRIII
jgi:alanine racemase